MTQPLRESLAAARAVLFDFDNVVVDSEPFHYEAYRRVFAGLGHSVDAAEYWIHWTSRGEGRRGDAPPRAWRSTRRRCGAPRGDLLEFCASGRIPFYPQAREIATLLRGARKRLAVASGTPTADILASCATAGWRTPSTSSSARQGEARQAPPRLSWRRRAASASGRATAS